MHAPGLDVDGAHREPRRAGIEPRRIGKPRHRLLELVRRVERGALDADRRRRAEREGRIGPVIAGDPADEGTDVRSPVGELGGEGPLAEQRRKRGILPPRPIFHRRPEFAHPLDALLRRVARNQAGIDGPARGADHPVGLDARLVKRLIDPALIRIECPAALESENDLPRQAFLRLRLDGGERGVLDVHHIVPVCNGVEFGAAGIDLPVWPMFPRPEIGRSAWVAGRISQGREPMKIDGRCHCGRITFEAEVDPASVSICHCTDCQTLTGSAFRANIPTAAADFVLRSGTPKSYVKTAESGNKRRHAFCWRLRHADLRLRGRGPAELFAACRHDHAACGFLAAPANLASLLARLGRSPCRRAAGGEGVDGEGIDGEGIDNGGRTLPSHPPEYCLRGARSQHVANFSNTIMLELEISGCD